MKKKFDIKEISKKVDINIDDYSSKKLEQKEISNENPLYEVLKNQYNDWKNITMIALEQSNNKSILLYFMFVTVEIYIKAELTKNFNIISYDQCIPNFFFNSPNQQFQLRQLKHKVKMMLGHVNNNKNNPMFADLKNLIKIRRELEKLKIDKIINNDYTNLRYNCDDKTNFLFLKEENIISNKEKEKIKEVLKYVM